MLEKAQTYTHQFLRIYVVEFRPDDLVEKGVTADKIRIQLSLCLQFLLSYSSYDAVFMVFSSFL